MIQSHEYELLEKLYFFELERKQQLESNIALPTGAIVAALGVLGYYFTHFKFGGTSYTLASVFETGFLLFTAVSAILLSIAIYWCFQAAVGSTYEYLPGPDTLRDYAKQVRDWHINRNHNVRRAESDAQIEFDTYLATSMAKCGQLNWRTNLVRSEELYNTKRYTILGLVALALCASCFYIDFWFDPPMSNG
jgi:hypothetical protein